MRTAMAYWCINKAFGWGVGTIIGFGIPFNLSLASAIRKEHKYYSKNSPAYCVKISYMETVWV